MHRVAVYAFEGMAPFELGVATEVFALPRPELDVPWWYSFVVCADVRPPAPLPVLGGMDLVVRHGLRTLTAADTVIVPGVADVYGEPGEPVLRALRRAHARGARMVSICSGAFALAAAGLLDGRTVTTHWRYAELLARRYPAVTVDGDALYRDEGDVVTSAGTAAGIDVCLHLVRRDHGAEVANHVARRMVVPAHRHGDQAQFVEAPVAARAGDDPIAATAEWALGRLGERLSVAALAHRAHLSPRQFTRRFRAAMGMSPARWLLEQRVQASLPLLESSGDGVEAIGRAVGFAAPAAFRRHFRDVMGVPPAAYRRSFRSDVGVAPAVVERH